MDKITRAARVRAILQLRRYRESLFTWSAFADPAWDMILELYACHLEGTQIDVKSATVASAVPATTALRHLKMLEENGTLHSATDPNDGRRRHVWLSEEAIASLDTYSQEVQRVLTPLFAGDPGQASP